MANDFYTKSGVPVTGAALQSAPIRTEIANIEAGFDKMPTMTGNGGKTVRVNAGATALDVSKVTITEPATSATLTIADGATLTASASATVSGTHSGTSSGTNTGDQTAATVSNTPAGSITATNVQAAINELDTEKAKVAGDAAQAFNTAALTASGVVTVTAGSAAAPAITTAGDTNCGFFFPAADTVAVATAGTERMRIDSSGNIGFGNTTPSSFASTLNYVFGSGSGTASTTVYTGPTSVGGLYFAKGTTGADRYTGFLEYNQNLNQMLLGTASANSLTISSSGETTVVKPALLGYGAGAGGTVTQTTSKSTAVTLNKPCGRITMHNAALAANTTVSFIFNNSLLIGTDVTNLTIAGGTGTAGAYQVWAESGGSAAVIFVRNITAGSLSEALVLNFAVNKATTA